MRSRRWRPGHPTPSRPTPGGGTRAFAALAPVHPDALKADPAALYKLVYYHMFLGLLGPDDLHGQRPTQQGAEINVTGKGGDIKVNDTAKEVCGGIQASNARIYMIDT